MRVGVRAVYVGMGEQFLPDNSFSNNYTADGRNLIAGFAVFDCGLAFNAGPSVVVERTNNSPDFFGGSVRSCAVI